MKWMFVQINENIDRASTNYWKSKEDSKTDFDIFGQSFESKFYNMLYNLLLKERLKF